nr:replication initiation protein RepC [Pseudaminobacter sp.]
RAEMAGLRLMRERITLHRRDIHKLIEAAVDEGVAGDWNVRWRRFRAIVETIPRRATLVEMREIVGALEEIHQDVDNLLETHMNAQNPSGNESHNERQYHNSNTNSHFEFEPGFEKAPVGPAEAKHDRKRQTERTYPIGLVLKACPEIADYAVDGIHNWRDLMATAAQVRGYLGISPSAYAEALEVLGQEAAAVVIACILQRANHITSAGGYLRVLTEKARAGEFSVGPMLMAALRASQPPSKMAG